VQNLEKVIEFLSSPLIEIEMRLCEYGKNILRRIAPRFEFFNKRSAVKANLEKCHFMTALAQERVEMK